MKVITQPVSTDTKAVVIMFGWVGSLDKHLKKYADLYINHSQQRCAVVYGTSTTATSITRSSKKLTAMVLDSVRKAASIIRTVEQEIVNINDVKDIKYVQKNIPVVIHYFSNGGAFVAEKMNEMMRDIVTRRMDKKISPNDVDDFKIINERLKTKGFEILDSCPAYMKYNLYMEVIDRSVQLLPLRAILKTLIFFSHAYKRIMSCVCNRDKVEVLFWKNMLENDLCQRQVYVYSANDSVTDPKMVEEMINARRKRGFDVTALKFEDSEHVLHFKIYPDEYKEKIVDYVLKTICA